MKKRLAVVLTIVALGLTGVAGPASAHHIAIVGDNTNPDSTYVASGTCSSTAVTPGGNYVLTDSRGYNYRLRYSTSCRSVWARALVGAPYGTSQRARRTSGPAYTTTATYAGATYRWSGQVDDAGHAAYIYVSALGSTATY